MSNTTIYNAMLQITISIADFKAIISETVRVELQLIQNNFKKEEPKILSRKQAAAVLQINISTLHTWTEDGRIKKYKTGGRVYYKSEDINAILNN